MKLIVDLIIALPVAIKALCQVVKYLRNTFGDSPRKVIRDTGETFRKLNESKTAEEKKKAADEIKDLVNRL